MFYKFTNKNKSELPLYSLFLLTEEIIYPVYTNTNANIDPEEQKVPSTPTDVVTYETPLNADELTKRLNELTDSAPG